jgi:hypothetical protein
MKIPAGISKWGIAALGVVCLLLVVKLVGQYRANQPGRSSAHPAPVGRSLSETAKGSSHAADDLAQYDPSIHFDTLKKLDSRPLPAEDRDPFGALAAAPPPVSAEATPPANAPPPPPPAPQLAAVGYNELPGGAKEAMISFLQGDRKDEIVTVHEGDAVSGTKFKITKITSTMVVVEDGETNKTLELPFPP